jgi:transcriptional regulator with XRE-family HTH domain
MKTLDEVAAFLREHMRKHRVTQLELCRSAGVASRTLNLMLKGSRDYRLTTLFAVADRLGLEVVLVPKAAAAAVQGGAVTEPAIETVVQAAMEGRLGQRAVEGDVR